MGFCVTFRCTLCGLEATVSGHPDVGLNIRTETRFCVCCETLVDVAVDFTSPPEFLSFEYDSFNFDKCPHRQHAADKQWVSGDPCPRCSGIVAKTEGDSFQWI